MNTAEIIMLVVIIVQCIITLILLKSLDRKNRQIEFWKTLHNQMQNTHNLTVKKMFERFPKEECVKVIDDAFNERLYEIFKEDAQTDNNINEGRK